MNHRATAYLRTSSAANIDGDSPYRQNNAVMAFAAHHGIEVVSCFWDAAVSGADVIETRDGFAALLAHCEDEGIVTVIVEEPSRFARSVIAQELGVALLVARGIRLVTASGQDLTDDGDSSKVFMRQVFGAASQYEKAKAVERLRKAREKVRATTGKCEGRRSHAERHPTLPQEARRLARKSPKTGRRRSLRGVAAELAALGFLSDSGTPLSPSIIQRLLRG